MQLLQSALTSLHSLLICCGIVAIACGAAAPGTKLSPDRGALLAFKDAITNDPSNVLSSWKLSDPTPCSWRGITCSKDMLTVRTLNLTGCGLSGALPAAIGNLSSLVSLDLSANNFSGALPHELPRCRKLKYIDLSQNAFNGEIPADIFKLSSLHTVYLYENKLSGELSTLFPDEDIGISNLQLLYLHGNALSGFLPPSISRWSNLTELILTDNKLEGTIPSELGLLKRMQYLQISKNSFKGAIPKSFGNFRDLGFLDLSENFLTGDIPSELGNCSMLNTLSLNGNLLTGPIPSSLSRNLIYLDLSQNNLTGSIPLELFECTGMWHLGLVGNRLSGSIPPQVGRLYSIRELWLGQNNLTGSIPWEIGNLSQLIDLNLPFNQLRGSIPHELNKLRYLSLVYLNNNQLDGEIPRDFGKHNNLSEVDLSRNKLTGEIPRSICRSGQLTIFVIIDNSIYGSIDQIASCTSIQRLRLSFNMLNGTIPKEFGKNRGLYMLDLASNLLQGSIPSEISLCSNLSTLDISSNRISGPIPDFGRLSKLQSYNASGNNLNGSFPVSLSGCRQLVSLDVSNNHLQGMLPGSDFLSNLTRLQKLVLSRNNFSGKIPDGFFPPTSSLLELTLDRNRLEGTIPRSIGQLVFLSISLNLSWNNLSGPVPPELGRLSQLQQLDMSHNHLSGRLPEALSGMVSLMEVNFSFNNLTGDLPEGPWRQLRASSFVGNSELCVISNSSSGCAGQALSPSSDKQGKKGLVLGIVLGVSGLLFVIVIVGCVLFLLKGAKSSTAEISSRRSVPSIKLFGDSTKLLTVADMDDVLTHLHKDNMIGEGAHGAVYKVVSSKGFSFAIKKIVTKNAMQMKQALQSFERELETAGTFRHKNLAKILGYRSGEDCSLIVYEFMSNGSLSSLLQSERAEELGWQARCNIAMSAAQALAYLHHDCVPMVIHRDVKSSNILLDDHMEAKLSDFGMAKLIDEDIKTMSAVVGTFGYIAPEYCYTMRVDEKVDVYAFGVVLLELVTRRLPCDPSFAEGVDLVSWVRTQLQKTGELRWFVDPILLREADTEEVMKMSRVALLCTAADPLDRPSMLEVVRMLEPPAQRGYPLLVY